MAIIQIGIDQYVCPESWAEIPLNKAIRLNEACAALPNGIRAVYAPVFDEKAEPITLKDEERPVFELFQRDVVGILCDIPAEILNQVGVANISEVYGTMLEPYAMSMMYQTLGFEPSEATSFNWRGETYNYPAAGTDIAGNPVYMQGLSALQLAQITDLAAAGDKMEGGEYAHAAAMVAIACLKEGEQYAEAIIKERMSLFSTVPMSVVLEVFFCLQQLITISQLNTRIATAEAERREMEVQAQASRSHG